MPSNENVPEHIQVIIDRICMQLNTQSKNAEDCFRGLV